MVRLMEERLSIASSFQLKGKPLCGKRGIAVDCGVGKARRAFCDRPHSRFGGWLSLDLDSRFPAESGCVSQQQRSVKPILLVADDGEGSDSDGGNTVRSKVRFLPSLSRISWGLCRRERSLVMSLLTDSNRVT